MAAGVHVFLLLVLSTLLGLVGDRTLVSAVRVATVGATFTLCLLVMIIVSAVLLLPWAVRLIRSSRAQDCAPRPPRSPACSCSCWSRRVP